MKRLFFHPVLLLSTLLLLAAGLLFAESNKENPCSGVSEKTVRAHLPVAEFTIESKQPRFGLCEVILRVKGRLVPLYGKKNFFIAGDLYLEKTKVTGHALSRVQKRIFISQRSRIEKNVVMTYAPKKSTKRVLYLFTDPLCPYCHEAGEAAMKLADRYNVTLKVLLYPVHGEKGVKKSVEAVCRKFTFQQYNNLKWKSAEADDSFQCARGKRLVKEAEVISESLGIDGVPAFYFDNGVFVSGADMKEVEAELKKPSGKK